LFPSDFRPAELIQRKQAFDDPDFIYELKYDGFRALANITLSGCDLISRRGNVYKSFAPLRESLRTVNCEAIIDGEIVVLDKTGRAQFYELLRRRGQPVFYAFDCLMHQGQDLRANFQFADPAP
jgi:bifunctional non-homologous end joining protein LigD